MVEITEKKLHEILLRQFNLPTHGVDGTPIDTSLYCFESLYGDDHVVPIKVIDANPGESPIRLVSAATAEAATTATAACSKQLWPAEATKAVRKPGPLGSLAIQQHIIKVEPFVLARPPSKGNDPALMTAVGLFAYSLAGVYLLVKISSKIDSNTILQAIAFLEFNQMSETNLPMLSD